MKKRALIHVENFQGLEEFASFLSKSGWQILATGETEKFLKSVYIPVTHTEALEQQNSVISSDYSILEQQILASHSDDDTFDDPLNLSRLSHTSGQEEISLVCMNFSPFLFPQSPKHQLNSLAQPASFFATTVLRTSYYNAKNVIILTDPDDYKEATIQLTTGSITQQFRAYLAAKALNMISSYDAGIAYTILHTPQINQTFMNYLMVPYTRHSLHSGANGQQQACLYNLPLETGAVSGFSKLQTEHIDYNLISDVSHAWEAISTLYSQLKSEYSVPSTNADGYDYTTQFTPLTGTVFTIAVKFESTIGAALSTNALDSIIKTSNFDKEITDVSLGCSSVVDKDAALEIIKWNYAAVIAPSFTPEAEEILNTKKNIQRISTSKVFCTTYEGKLVNGGLLIQTRDSQLFKHWQVKTKNRPDQNQIDQMSFGTLLTLAARSYSAILLKENHIAAIAQSCTTNKKALNEVCIPITDFNVSADLLVCDAPITWCDSIRYIIDKGVKAIIQPGGTPDDDELTKYCDEHGVVMIFTNMTHINY